MVCPSRPTKRKLQSIVGSSTCKRTTPYGSKTPQSQSASFGSGLFGSTTPIEGSFTFGGSVSTTQATSFSSTTLQGSVLFGSTAPFGGSTQAVCGASSVPAFGSTVSPAFRSTTPGFGVSNNVPVFGSTVVSFGSSTTSPFGNASTSPAFVGAPKPTPATGSVWVSSATNLGRSASVFGNSNPFGSIGTTSFGGQSSSFGVQTTTPAFGNAFRQPAFGGQRGGSRVAPYAPTTEADAPGNSGPAGKLESISAMPVYKDKSHEELRLEDYQSGDRETANALGQSALGGQHEGSRVAAPYVHDSSSSMSNQLPSTLLTFEKSTNLLKSISSMKITRKLNSQSSSEISGSADLHKQRKILKDYSSLEAIDEANAFPEIERISLLLLQHSSNALERAILKHLVSLLATFKEIVPDTKSRIEAVRAQMVDLSRKKKDVRGKLHLGQERLNSLQAEFSKILQEERKPLGTQKEKLLRSKARVVLELEKTNEQVWKDLDEWKVIDKEDEVAAQDWIQARVKLAQANLNWQLFKQNLELCDQKKSK